VVGNACDHEGRYQAFLWSKKQGSQNIAPSRGFSSAVAINNVGTVLIQSFSDEPTWLYKSGALHQIKMQTDQPTNPRAINDCEVVVGSMGPYSDVSRGFVWSATTGLYELNRLISPKSQWNLRVATGINNRGEIVGWGEYGDDDQEGFLLIPAD
jgi:hypothetical protein